VRCERTLIAAFKITESISTLCLTLSIGIYSGISIPF
jgi:hypothetical protein